VIAIWGAPDRRPPLAKSVLGWDAQADLLRALVAFLVAPQRERPLPRASTAGALNFHESPSGSFT
jgi:hypothetical protein